MSRFDRVLLGTPPPIGWYSAAMGRVGPKKYRQKNETLVVGNHSRHGISADASTGWTYDVCIMLVESFTRYRCLFPVLNFLPYNPLHSNINNGYMMELNLKREIYTKTSTIGRLEIDGNHFCYILEDVDRKVENDSALKVHGKTAIPRGRYQIVVTLSNRFKVKLPLLVNVPGFEGIRIHPGNTSEDTEGCLLPGLSHQLNMVVESRRAFNALHGAIVAALDAGNKVWITIQ